MSLPQGGLLPQILWQGQGIKKIEGWFTMTGLRKVLGLSGVAVGTIGGFLVAGLGGGVLGGLAGGLLLLLLFHFIAGVLLPTILTATCLVGFGWLIFSLWGVR